MKVILSLFLLVLSFALRASEYELISGEEHVVTSAASIHLDSTGQLKPLEVYELFRAGKCKPTQASKYSAGFSEDPLWVCLPVHNQSTEEDFVLSLSNVLLRDVQVFYLEQGKVEPLTSDMRAPSLTWKFSLAPYERGVFLMRVKSHGKLLEVNLSIESQVSFEYGSYGRFLRYGLVYGLLIFVVAINFFYFYLFKRRAHLYYGLYGLSVLGSFFYIDGTPYLLPFSENTHTHINLIVLRLTAPFLSICLVYMANFQLKNWVRRVVWGFVSVVVIETFVQFIVGEPSFPVFAVTAPLFAFLSIGLNYAVLRSKSSELRILRKYYSWSILVLMCGLMIYGLDVGDVIDLPWHSMLVPQMASMIDVLIMSFAVSREMRAAKEKEKMIEEEHQALLLEAQDLKFKNLQLQLNPHFLFNALSYVQYYIRKGELETSNERLSEVAGVMRQTLDNSRNDFISLQKEMQYLEQYVGIHQVKFEGRFQFDLCVGEDIFTKQTFIPTMFIQPYLENAFKHAWPEEKTEAKLSVKIQKADEGALRILIEDNGVGIDEDGAGNVIGFKQESSVGLQVMEERIRTLNKLHAVEAHVEVIDRRQLEERQCGTRIVLILPYTLLPQHTS